MWPHEVEPWFHSWYRGRVDVKYNLYSMWPHPWFKESCISSDEILLIIVIALGNLIIILVMTNRRRETPLEVSLPKWAAAPPPL